jgi:hypothetical protein
METSNVTMKLTVFTTVIIVIYLFLTSPLAFVTLSAELP